MRVINNRYTFIIILILLILSVGLLTTSIILKINNYGSVPYVDPNPDHELLHDGVLYFYNIENKLIGTYQCKPNYVYCGLAYETIDDDEYGFRSPSDGKIDVVQVENNRYAFIVDTEMAYEGPEDSNILLYDLIKKETVKEFSGVKNYTVGLNDSIVFVKEIYGGWRIMRLKGSNPIYLSDYTYEYVSVHNTILNNGRLDSANIVTYDGTSWQLINDAGTERTTKSNKKIIDYNYNYIIYSNNGLYQLQTLSEYALLKGSSFKDIRFIDGFPNYAELINMDDQYYIADFNANTNKSSYYKTSDYPDISARVNENQEIEIVANNQVLEVVK